MILLHGHGQLYNYWARLVQAANHSVKLRGAVAPGEEGKAVSSTRAKSTDKTTKLLIVILVLFLVAEFPQVGFLSPVPTMLNSRRLKFLWKVVFYVLEYFKASLLFFLCLTSCKHQLLQPIWIFLLQKEKFLSFMSKNILKPLRCFSKFGFL